MHDITGTMQSRSFTNATQVLLGNGIFGPVPGIPMGTETNQTQYWNGTAWAAGSGLRTNATGAAVGTTISNSYQFLVNKNLVAASAAGRFQASISSSTTNVGIDAFASGATSNNTAIKGAAISSATAPAIGLDINVSGTGTNIAAQFTGGNVGIGTTNPQNQLHVNGGITAKGMSLISHSSGCKTTSSLVFDTMFQNRVFIPPGTTAVQLEIKAYSLLSSGSLQFKVGSSLSSNVTLNGIPIWHTITISNPPSGWQDFTIDASVSAIATTASVCEFNLVTN